MSLSRSTTDARPSTGGASAGTAMLATPIGRRRLLQAFGVLGVATLAGCGTKGSDSSASTVASGTGVGGGSSSSSATPTSSPSSSSSAAAMASSGSSASDLTFPVDDFTEQTATVTTASGTRQVTYRSYENITYVAKPVDAAYQSMNVKVPTAVDGRAVDAAKAPILFAIGVGGYMSATAGGGMGGGVMGPRPTGSMPPGGAAPAGAAPGGPMGAGGSGSSDLALAAGFVVVEPGCRGRDNQLADGTYFGKAPAAIVDLKAAVRYLRRNAGVVPGDTDRIVSRGTSAGGALSALLAASGDSPQYASHLNAIGAADASDAIFASADFCPITDLEHADMAYEWEFGAVAVNGALVDQELSAQLASAFDTYVGTLGLKSAGASAPLTAEALGEHLVRAYLAPSATTYLSGLSESDRATYIAENAWISWTAGTASFTFADYAQHVGRMKSLPAFDAFDLSAAENVLFGNATTDARHFTTFSLRHDGAADAALDADLPEVIDLMNPMHFIGQGWKGCAGHWWIRHGTADSNTALSVITNLAMALEGQGKNVNVKLYWDAGHGADDDPDDFIAWIAALPA